MNCSGHLHIIVYNFRTSVSVVWGLSICLVDFFIGLSMWYVVDRNLWLHTLQPLPIFGEELFQQPDHNHFTQHFYRRVLLFVVFFSFSIRGVMFSELRRNFYDALLLWYTQWILTDKWSELWRWKYYKFLLCSILYPILEIKPAEYHFCVVFLIEK